MAQHDYELSNQSGISFRSDTNDLFAAILSNNSGASAPTTTTANMLWYDTTDSFLKIRNEADNAFTNSILLGPLVNIDNAVPRYNAANSSIIQTSGVTIDDSDMLEAASLKANSNVTDLLQLYRPVNTVSTKIGVNFLANNASSAETNYAKIQANVIDNTAGAQSASLLFVVRNAGVNGTYLSLLDTGAMTTGTVPTAITATTGELLLAALEQDSATDGQGMIWSTANSTWEPQTLAGTGTIGGSGTVGTIPKFVTDTTTIGDSIIIEDATGIGIGTSSINGRLEVSTGPQWSSANFGANIVISGTRNNVMGFLDAAGNNPWAIGSQTSGSLVFSTMPALGDTATAQVERLSLGSSESVFNGTGASVDTRAEGDTITDLLLCDASADTVEFNGFINFGGAPEEVTIASGVITITRSYIRVTGETTTDTLVTINGGTEGDILLMTPNSGDTILFNEGDNLRVAAIGSMGSSTHDGVLWRRGPTSWKTIEIGH